MLSDPVAVLGLGLIGGSLGQALTTAGIEVRGWDPNGETLAQAVQQGAIQFGAASPKEAAEGAALVVLCAPLGAIIPLLQEIAPNLRAEAVVTDVGSAKRRIVLAAQDLIGGRFVGGHPMAGSEEAGIASSSPRLFAGAPWLLTPTRFTDQDAIEAAQQMTQAAGALTRFCDPDTHDEVVAYLSHLPHVLSYGLAKTALAGIQPQWTDAAAGSFRDGARVAKSDPARWAEILMDNREATAEAVDRFIGWAARVRTALQIGDAETLASILSDAHLARKQFPQ